MSKWKFRSDEGIEGADLVSLIGEGTVFTGDLELKGGARIDGKVVGRITAHSLLIVGPSADIEAQELRGTRVTVCGTIRGRLVVDERIEIQPGGRVVGQIVMEKEGLVVAPGGVFEGAVEYVKRGEAADAPAQPFPVEAIV
jgi:cytoskeletal protein CcmA (bactofilin family)